MFVVHLQIVLVKQFNDQEVIVNHNSEDALERQVRTYLSVDQRKSFYGLWIQRKIFSIAVWNHTMH
jgi:hypothetical protein